VRVGTKAHDLLESDTVSDEAAKVRAEWRADEAQWSRAALERWEHGLALVDVLRACAQRGDTVTFEFPSVTWTGRIVGVGADIARVEAGDASVDVHLAADAPFVLRTRPGPHSGDRARAAVATFAARLRELDGTAVSVGAPTGSLEGSLRVGLDQIRLTRADCGVSYVPSASVWWVRPVDD